MNGHPVTIVEPCESGKFKLEEKALESILLQDGIENSNVVVISVAGAFRQGKSFLLDFFLRYLNAKESFNWMGAEDTPLGGFSWKGGSHRDTTGILLWSEVFVRQLPSGEKVAILLMDTQGLFDNDTSHVECVKIFTLSTLLSSIQIYNISQNIREDYLQYLQLFTEFGRLVQKDCERKPFQSLMFLVRDWGYPYEFKYGAEGGLRKLNECLKVSADQHPELQFVRRNIRSCYENISCFLMPNPGSKVTTSQDFDGRLSDIDDLFKEHLQVLVPLILGTENLVVKRIGNQNVTAKEFVQYFKSYIEIFNGDDLPEPKSMLAATADINNMILLNKAKDLYREKIDEVCGSLKPVNRKKLQLEHGRIKDEVMKMFHSERKIGGEEFSKKYAEELSQYIEDIFSSMKSFNELKVQKQKDEQIEKFLLGFAVSGVMIGAGMITSSVIGAASAAKNAALSATTGAMSKVQAVANSAPTLASMQLLSEAGRDIMDVSTNAVRGMLNKSESKERCCQCGNLLCSRCLSKNCKCDKFLCNNDECSQSSSRDSSKEEDIKPKQF